VYRREVIEIFILFAVFKKTIRDLHSCITAQIEDLIGNTLFIKISMAVLYG
jgi:hypothetical protein